MSVSLQAALCMVDLTIGPAVPSFDVEIGGWRMITVGTYVELRIILLGWSWLGGMSEKIRSIDL